MELAQRDTQIPGKEQSTEMNPWIYGQLIYNKEAKNMQWEKGSLFNKLCQENNRVMWHE